MRENGLLHHHHGGSGGGSGSLARSIEQGSASMVYKTGRCFRPLYVMCLSRTILVLGFLFVIWQSYNSECSVLSFADALLSLLWSSLPCCNCVLVASYPFDFSCRSVVHCTVVRARRRAYICVPARSRARVGVFRKLVCSLLQGCYDRLAVSNSHVVGCSFSSLFSNSST